MVFTFFVICFKFEQINNGTFKSILRDGKGMKIELIKKEPPIPKEWERRIFNIWT